MKIFKFELKPDASDDTTHILIAQGEGEDDAWKVAEEYCAHSRDKYEVEECTEPLLYAHLTVYEP